MRTLILTALAAAAVGAASLLTGSATPVQAQSFSTQDLRNLVATPKEQTAPHRRVVHRHYPRRVARYGYYYGYYYAPNPYSVTGAIGPAGTGPELWPPCYYGPPACTAAGYPNLNYYRELQGYPSY
ncbi:hypothetical protein [Microvirga terricola]|uniref:Uncharacterized protein n=1 Tax=Microvirga terricola TaxID=2719797 RepID=A0ABX0V6J4_9HYPH|nr:hypothetical protein [Microvirga terricola]NIX75459.1 hypothetical protein [Microvirga terricola]